MTSEATLKTEANVAGQVLYMTFELSQRTWKVLFATTAGGRRERSVSARDLGKLFEEIAAAKRRFGLPPHARVISCYEAGRDGFWLDRALRANGIENLVVDSASIEVPRRARRRKTDRLDVGKLMALLRRWADGERKAWSVVRVPSPEAEDVRQLSRAIERLKAERGRHRTRIQALLATQGLRLERIGGRGWAERVAGLRTWEDRPLGRWLQSDLVLEGARLAQVEEQLAALKAERDTLVATSDAPVAVKARRLAALGAIAAESSFVFATELFGWRTFANRRELAGAVGLTGTPWRTGNTVRDQGVSKAGNRRMRTTLVEIAWCWLRYQPMSALSRWWQSRFATVSGRTRKAAIVALARKLLVALWRYLEHGLVPDGAVLKRRAAPCR
jgi:transposase